MSRPHLSLVPSHAHKLGLRHQQARQEVAGRLVRARSRLGWSQERAAQELGMATRSYAALERRETTARPAVALVLMERWAAERKEAA